MKTRKTIMLVFALGLSVVMLVAMRPASTEVESVEPSETVEHDPSDPDHCNEVCCDSLRYCGISVSELDRYMINYRNEVWSKTSPYFSTHSYMANWNILVEPDPPMNNSLFDTRYIDVALSDLENYICTVKQSEFDGCEHFEPNVLRFYLIRYDGLPRNRVSSGFGFSSGIGAYQNKTSFAIVPVESKSGVDDVECYSLSNQAQQSFSAIFTVKPNCSKSLLQNHNHICPPLVGCDITGSRIMEVDTHPF